MTGHRSGVEPVNPQPGAGLRLPADRDPLQGAAWDKTLHAIVPEAEARWPLIALGALFTVAFFSVPFLMFHFVHSVSLNQFFPLHGNGNGFPRFLPIVGICIVRYWPVIVFSAITQLTSFLQVAESTGSNFLSMPYRNVVKMHIGIFVFAGLSFANISGLALYDVLILYFFPFGSLKTFLAGTESPFNHRVNAPGIPMLRDRKKARAPITRRSRL